MKKLALVMIFVLLMALFIAFNYLLLDRENKEAVIKDLENRNADYSASINANSREIKSLEDENSNYQTQISELKDENQKLQQGKDQAANDMDQVQQELSAMIGRLNTMKKLLDEKQLESPVVKWVEAINAGKYDDAYNLEYRNIYNEGKPVSISDYSDNLKKTVKSITIKDIGLDPEKGNDTGDIYLKADLDVKLVEDAPLSLSRFQAGENTVYFKLDYDTVENVFIISQIE